MAADFLMFDHRMTWLRTLADSTNSALNQLKTLSELQPWFDGTFMLEHSEYFLGPLAVAAHTYCVGAIADFKRFYPELELSKRSKQEFFRLYPNTQGKPTSIELLCAVSNLFKHRDEWGSPWPTNYTTGVLAQFGIEAKTEFPVYQGFSELDLWSDLGGRLQSLLEEWGAIISIEAEKGAK